MNKINKYHSVIVVSNKGLYGSECLSHSLEQNSRLKALISFCRFCQVWILTKKRVSRSWTDSWSSEETSSTPPMFIVRDNLRRLLGNGWNGECCFVLVFWRILDIFSELVIQLLWTPGPHPSCFLTCLGWIPLNYLQCNTCWPAADKNLINWAFFNVNTPRFFKP